MAQIFSSKAFDVIGDAVYAVFDAAAKECTKSGSNNFSSFKDKYSQKFLNIHSETTFKFISKMKKCMDKDLALEATKNFFKEIIYLKDKWYNYEPAAADELGGEVDGMFMNKKFIWNLVEKAKSALVKNKMEYDDDDDVYYECSRVIGLLCLSCIEEIGNKYLKTAKVTDLFPILGDEAEMQEIFINTLYSYAVDNR